MKELKERWKIRDTKSILPKNAGKESIEKERND